MRVLPRDQVWSIDAQQVRNLAPDQEVKPRFAGEQQITTAILALSQEKKAKVCFVRPGGPPLTTPGMMPFQRGGPMSQVGERLRQYNFQVLEKDLSGSWAMQAQMQQMPSPPEPSDAEIKDAIWIVMNFQGQENPMQPTAPIAPKVADHLKNGGSAFIMFAPRADNMSAALKDWGIEVRADAIAVHTLVKQGEGRPGGRLSFEDAQRLPYVFDIRDYGDHLITKPVRSLPSMLVPIIPVKPADAPVAGVKVTPIIPLPGNAWGETDWEAMEQGNADPKFDEGKDVKRPIFAGAVAEKEKAGRLVVIASPFPLDEWTNPLLRPDPALLKQRILAARFPGNMELFCNSVFWLAHMEPMIAISPAAMEVARIEPMSEGGKRRWNGFLWVGMPSLVIAAGIMVYISRRD
jgi:hypothetical protein